MGQLDVYSVTLVGSLYSQQTVNVFFYEQTNAFVPLVPTAAQALAQEWDAQIAPPIANLVSRDVTFTSVSVRNLFNIADAYDLLISRQGSGGGATPAEADSMSAFNAYDFELNGTNAAVRNGRKRFPGVNEVYVTDGVVTTAGFLSGTVAAVETALESPVNIGVLLPSPVFYPVIVKRVREGIDPNYTYRLPRTIGEKIVSVISTVAFNVLITSQISRKIGIGV